MKARYTELKGDRQWKSAIGLDEARFLKLAQLFKTEYRILFGKSKEENAEDSPKGMIVKTEEDLLFMLLFSLKTGLTEDVLGFIFGMERSSVSKNKGIALRVLSNVLYDLELIPKREFSNISEFEAHMKKYSTLIIDGTEHRVQRPDNEEDQKNYYSGKKNVIR